jgi:hypothetical protein
VSDDSTLSEALTLHLDKLNAEDVTLSETFDRTWTALLELNDNSIISEIISKSIDMILTFEPGNDPYEVINQSETFTKSIDPVYSDNVTTSEVELTFDMSTVLLDNVLTSENIIKEMGEDRWDDDVTNVALSETFTLQWTASLSFQDNQTLTEYVILDVSVTIDENLLTSEVSSFDFSKVLSEDLTLTETVTIAWDAQHEAFEYLTVSETFEKSIDVQLSDVVNLTEDMVIDYTPGTQNFDEYYTDTPSITESGLLNLQNYVDGGYFAEDFAGTNTTF